MIFKMIKEIIMIRAASLRLSFVATLRSSFLSLLSIDFRAGLAEFQTSNLKPQTSNP